MLEMARFEKYSKDLHQKHTFSDGRRKSSRVKKKPITLTGELTSVIN